MLLNIYKKGQGKYTRLYSAFAVATICGLGCLQLYKKFEAADFGLWLETMIPAGLFAIMIFSIFWLVNKPSLADFMIAAEGEMKKVNWSSRKEIVVSTFVVIVVVVFMAALLGVVDLSFRLFFEWALS